MIVYQRVKDQIDDADCGPHIGYGIRVTSETGETRCFCDLSTNGEAVAALVERCMRQQLDPRHLVDVIDDFLVDLR